MIRRTQRCTSTIGGDIGLDDERALICLDVIADPIGAANLRRAFKTWLHNNFQLEDERSSALTLAVNEALANAVEHAYSNGPGSGTVDLRADYDADADELSVVVTDRGRWRTPEPDPLHLRGRGIPLMHALSERTQIEFADAGTTVQLGWTSFAKRAE